MKPSIALIGPGKVGCAVTKCLHLAGYPIKAVISRHLERATDGCHFIGCSAQAASTDLHAAVAAKLIFLAVPDDQIASLAKEIHSRVALAADQLLIHFSGLHPASIMQSATSEVATLSIHPLLPFANRDMASEQLTDCPCAIEGNENCQPNGYELVNAFSGRPFSLPAEKKALYHASASVASNFLVTLIATAAGLLEDCGIDPESTLSLLLPLIQASIANVSAFGPEQALTGPIVRGDTGTVSSHLRALESSHPQLVNFYQIIAHRTINLAQASTRLPEKKASRLHKLIELSTKRGSNPIEKQKSG